MDSSETYWNDRALLEWQGELGGTEGILGAPGGRFAPEGAKPAPKGAPGEKTRKGGPQMSKTR